MKISAHDFYKQVRDISGVPAYNVKKVMNAIVDACAKNTAAGHDTTIANGLIFKTSIKGETYTPEDGVTGRIYIPAKIIPKILLTETEKKRFREKVDEYVEASKNTSV